MSGATNVIEDLPFDTDDAIYAAGRDPDGSMTAWCAEENEGCWCVRKWSRTGPDHPWTPHPDTASVQSWRDAFAQDPDLTGYRATTSCPQRPPRSSRCSPS